MCEKILEYVKSKLKSQNTKIVNETARGITIKPLEIENAFKLHIEVYKDQTVEKLQNLIHNNYNLNTLTIILYNQDKDFHKLSEEEKLTGIDENGNRSHGDSIRKYTNEEKDNMFKVIKAQKITLEFCPWLIFYQENTEENPIINRIKTRKVIYDYTNLTEEEKKRIVPYNPTPVSTVKKIVDYKEQMKIDDIVPKLYQIAAVQALNNQSNYRMHEEILSNFVKILEEKDSFLEPNLYNAIDPNFSWKKLSKNAVVNPDEFETIFGRFLESCDTKTIKNFIREGYGNYLGDFAKNKSEFYFEKAAKVEVKVTKVTKEEGKEKALTEIRRVRKKIEEETRKIKGEHPNIYDKINETREKNYKGE